MHRTHKHAHTAFTSKWQFPLLLPHKSQFMTLHCYTDCTSALLEDSHQSNWCHFWATRCVKERHLYREMVFVRSQHSAPTTTLVFQRRHILFYCSTTRGYSLLIIALLMTISSSFKITMLKKQQLLKMAPFFNLQLSLSGGQTIS